MKFETVSYQEKDGILHVKLNRPEKRNAVNHQLISDVTECFLEVATQPSVKVVLLSGEGKCFSAGTDLTSFTAGSNQVDLRRFVRRYQKMFNEIELLEKVVIAVIHGYCFGAALELALACDMRICSEETLFNLPEVDMGIIPDGGGSQRLPRVIGLGRAKELILTGKTIDAHKAEQWGLVNKVVKLQELEATGIAWAQDVMRNGLIGVGLAKRNIDLSMDMGIYDALECTGLAQSMAFTDPSFLQRIQQRFLDKVKSKKS